LLRPLSAMHHAIHKVDNYFNPLFAIALVVCAFLTLKDTVWPFLLRNGVALLLVEGIAKFVQHKKVYGPEFPSTHYAFALSIATSFIILKRRAWPVVIALLIAYAIVVVPVQHYHTWLEVLAALYAVPLTLLFNWKPRAKSVGTAGTVHY
jgi:membrane-associated phospholipid phosphatase